MRDVVAVPDVIELALAADEGVTVVWEYAIDAKRSVAMRELGLRILDLLNEF